MANIFTDTEIDGVLSVSEQNSTTFTIATSSNVASSTNGKIKYVRIGGIVLFAFAIDVTPSAANTNTHFRFNPPVSSAFTDSRHAFGTVTAEDATASPRAYLAGGCIGFASGDQIEIRFTPDSVNTWIVRGSGMYTVL
jgi:hypothetical protein